MTQTYGDSRHKHAVTSRNDGWTYTYDANGNMNTRALGGQITVLSYDAENHLIGAGTATFVYDGDGKRVKVTDVMVFLASEQARWLTGQLIYVGGGWQMPL